MTTLKKCHYFFRQSDKCESFFSLILSCIFSLLPIYFLPKIPLICCGIYLLITLVIGLVGICLNRRLLLAVYVLAETFLEIPKITITAFLIYAIVNKKNCVKTPNYVGLDFFVLSCPKAHTSFELYLFNLDDFYLWSGLIVAVFSVSVSAMAVYLIGKGLYTHFRRQRKRAFAFAHANIHEIDDIPLPGGSISDETTITEAGTPTATPSSTKRPLFYSVSSTITI